MLKQLVAKFWESTPADFESRYPLNESVARVASAVEGVSWASFPGEAMVGRVSARRVEVSRRRWIRNSFKPYFCGSFSEQDGRVRLIGRFSMHWSARIFMLVWGGLGLLWVLGAALAVLIDPKTPWYLPLWGIALMLYGLLVVALGRWLGRRDVEWLSRQLRQVLG